ncbi:alcohol acetyltransferase [Ophiocordyceps camponoti-floridani]|uniref:Alcohol acetyltransferase n=1 Tax=Ophiocordyceps camponoti-floridani TaxID=2030778 RepID=A0A8H4Q7A6_9HYPO|nr:alcohol acetyltransferase [Ophiocordyceps camponoti-floridani]
MSTSGTPLRRLGNVELLSSTRHHLGIYRSVTLTCRYESRKPLTRARLHAALAKVVSSQPMLRVSIAREDSPRETHFVGVRVDVRRQVEWEEVDVWAAGGRVFHELLCEALNDDFDDDSDDNYNDNDNDNDNDNTDFSNLPSPQESIIPFKTTLPTLLTNLLKPSTTPILRALGLQTPPPPPGTASP